MKHTVTLRFIRMMKNLALAGLVFLAGCSNVIAPQHNKAGAYEPGTGAVRIDLAGSAARTLLPTAANSFSKYDLLFEDQAVALPDVTVSDYTLNDRVTLAEGTWTVTVSAYLNTGDSDPTAVGVSTVNVIYGTDGETVTVTLIPVDSAATTTGTGTFAWDISFPADTTTVTMEITSLDGSTYTKTIDLKTDPTGSEPLQVRMTGTKVR